MTASISGITDLGVIFEETVQVDNRLITVPRPLGNSSNTTTINLFGKTRTITLSGSHSGQGYGGGQAGIKAFITDIEDWVDSSLQSGVTFTDSFGFTYNVLSSTWQWVKTTPGNRILYVITMQEGGALAAFNSPSS